MGIVSKTASFINGELDRRIDGIQKSTSFISEPLSKAIKEDGYGRKGMIFDPFTDMGYSGGLFRPKGAGSGFLSNFILKLVSRRDPIVSTILHIRSNQVSTFCRRQTNRFDTGFEIKCQDATDDIDEDEIKEIEEFLLNCGNNEERSAEDQMTFDQWGYMITHDMLTYGHSTIEMIRSRDGGLHSFLPLPAETIYYANKALLGEDSIGNMIDTYRDVYQNMHGQKHVLDDETMRNEEYDYLQVINGKVVEGFTRDELVFAKVYELSEIDLNGYAIGPLERSISMVTAHLQIENHQKMFFTHGMASKGLLVIQGDVTPNQLRTLQAQWTNQVTGPSSAWRTPILAGIDGVQWQTLTGTNRDMEYAAYQDHVIRTLHSSFAIDPEETGFGYLSKGVSQKSLGESNNEWKITASRDRGLRPLLSRVESLINEDILPKWNKDLSEKYKFCFVGLDAENRQEEIDRLQAEVQLHTTLDEAREQADLDPMKIGGGLIMNPLLVTTLQSNIYKGVFMEKFLGVEGASERPDLQYIPDPFWFQWQEFQMQMMQQQSMAEVGMSPDGQPIGGGEGGGGNSGGENKSNSKDDKAKEKVEQDKQAEMQAQQQAMAEAQMAAVDKFISANPDLFKSMKDNLAKSEYIDEHTTKLQNSLVKDFEKASEKLMRDIFEVVKEDLEGRDESSPDMKVMSKTDFVSEESVGDFLTDVAGEELSSAKKKKKKKKKAAIDGSKKKDS